jgi:hypothetical protein
MNEHRRNVFRLGCLLVGACLALGCGGGDDPNAAIAKVNSTNLQRLSNLYSSFQMDHDWRGPADEEEFKAFLKGYNPRKLTRIGIDPASIDALFVSQRDGQLFKVRYGVRGSAMGSSEPVVFESEGVDGARQVGFLDMVQRDVAEPEYTQLWEGKVTASAPDPNTGRPR